MNKLNRKKRLTEKSLYQFLKRCRLEIKKCESAKAYLACIVLIGANLEYILTAWIRAYPGVVYSGNKKITDRWDLKDLNDLAYKYGFINRRALTASERIRKTRNMIHPNWYAGRKPIRFSKELMDARNADFDIIMDSMMETFKQ